MSGSSNARRGGRVPRASASIPALALAAGLVGGCAAPGPLTGPDWSAAPPPEPELVAPVAGGIWSRGGGLALFEDARAHRVGDVISVVLDEATAATKSATTSASRTTSIDLPTPTVLGSPVRIGGRELLAFEAAAGSDFQGGGDAAQSNRLDGRVAVTVERVYANGNLAIRGQKRLTLNNGGEHVRVSGIVRSIDVGPDNTVRSSELADARIVYAGDGLVADASRAGWLTRILGSALWPF